MAKEEKKMVKCANLVMKNKNPFKLIYGWSMQRHITEEEFVQLVSLAILRKKEA